MNQRATAEAMRLRRSTVEHPFGTVVCAIVQALMDKAQSGVSVRVIVDQSQYSGSSSTDQHIQATVAALRSAGIMVHPSSNAFCYTH